MRSLARACKTASTIGTRLLSKPVTTRRGFLPTGSTVKDCTSASIGRTPSIATVTAEPSGVVPRWERKSPDGSGTSRIPPAVCSKQPTSSVAPKRFLIPRSIRRLDCLSPSKFKTTSTKCSSTRGPATLPSLVTCPTSKMGIFVVLAKVVRAAVTARDWATPPATPSTPEACMVWTESTIISEGFSCSTCPKTTSRLDSAARYKVSCKAFVRSARVRTWPTDSSAVT